METQSLIFRSDKSGMKLCAFTIITLVMAYSLNAQNPCSNAYPIAGLGPAYQQTFLVGGTGVWNTPLCGFTTDFIEKVYSFNAPYTATYKIVVVLNPYGVVYAWLPTTCAQTGWYCIGNINDQGTYGSMYWTPGTYYFLLKCGSPYASNHNFYIICEPNPPTLLSATAVSTNQIDLTWSDVDGETGYKIYRAESLSGPWTQIGTTATNSTTYSDIGLTENTNYCYDIAAFNNDASSAYSNKICTTTLQNPASVPSNLTAIASTSGQINLSWSDVTGETGYKIYRKLNPSGSYSQVAMVAQDQTTYPDINLIQNSEYCYKITANNSGGESGFSNETCAVVNPDISPAPSNLTSTVISANQVDLLWEDVAGEAGYKIYRSESLTGTYTQIAIVNTNIVYYSNTGLSANNQYCYKVRSYNSGGESGYSLASCANTCVSAPPPPPAPANLTSIAIASGQMYLLWNDVNSEEGYNIYRANIPTGPYLFLACTNSDQPNYLDINLPANTPYCYKVKAYNTGGESDFSNDACSNTLSVFENGEINNSIRIYPNPSNNKLYIDIKDNKYKVESISLINPLGKIIPIQKGTETFAPNITIDLSEYSSGIYILSILTDTFVFNQKVVIER
jgi:fibronectin type 3 domain-containing protein